MKIVSALIVTTGLFSASFASAKNPEQAYIESFHGRGGTPVPVAVVQPKVPSGFSGATVLLEFTVDAAGTPVGIKSREAGVPAALLEPLVEAVAQWRFAPLTRDGVAVPARVILPVNIVSELEPAGLVATR